MAIIQRRLLGVKKKPSSSLLPKGYRPVPYIVSVGGAYINLNLLHQDYPSFKGTFKKTTANVYTVFGVEGSNSATCCYLASSGANWGTHNSVTAHYTSGYAGVYYLKMADWHTFEITYGSATIDGSRKDIAVYNFTPSNLSHILFGKNNKGVIEPSELAMGDFQAFTGLDNPTIARDLICCIRESDNEIGYYDMTNSVCPLTNTPFYCNAGSGYFIAGGVEYYTVNVTEVIEVGGVERSRVSTSYSRMENSKFTLPTHSTDEVVEVDTVPIYYGRFTKNITGVDVTVDDNGVATFVVTDNADITITYSIANYPTYATAPINLIHRFYKDSTSSTRCAHIIQSDVVTLTNNPYGTVSHTVQPLVGDVTSMIDGTNSFGSNIIVDADNFVYNRLYETSSNIEVDGATITFTNTSVEGSLSAITVYVDYVIDTSAVINIVHEYYVNGAQVIPSITNSPSSKRTLTVGNAGQTIVMAKGSCNYKGTSYDLADFTKTFVLPEDGSIVYENDKLSLVRYNTPDTTITVRYELAI